MLDALILLDVAPGGHLPAQDLYYDPGYIVLATFGALIITRQPDQIIGWLFCAASLLAMVGWIAGAYEQFAGAEMLPLLVWIIWLGTAVSFSPLLILLSVVPYLFPTGQLLSTRWKPLVAISCGVILVSILGEAFGTELVGNDDRRLNANPLYVSAVKSIYELFSAIGFFVLVLTMVGAVTSLGLRYRRSRGVERLQIRWLFWMLGVIIALILILVFGQILIPAWINLPDGGWTLPEVVIGLSILFGISIGIPFVLGLSILRYQLYSIDVLVNKTLVYGSLTFGLGLIYGVCVVFLQLALGSVTSASDLAVAGSTLAVAALFQPLRRRIQRGVDRRFFRQKYDAARAVEAFNERLRHAISTDEIRAELLEVVRSTIQPATVSLRLHDPAFSKSSHFELMPECDTTTPVDQLRPAADGQSPQLATDLANWAGTTHPVTPALRDSVSDE